MQARLRTVFGRAQARRIGRDSTEEPMHERLLDATAILEVGDNHARDLVATGVNA